MAVKRTLAVDDQFLSWTNTHCPCIILIPRSANPDSNAMMSDARLLRGGSQLGASLQPNKLTTSSTHLPPINSTPYMHSLPAKQCPQTLLSRAFAVLDHLGERPELGPSCVAYGKVNEKQPSMSVSSRVRVSARLQTTRKKTKRKRE